MRKLRGWFVRRAAETGEHSEATLAALAMLVNGFSAGERDRVAAGVLDALRRGYAASEAEVPSWMRKLLD